jgi:hypothetical protein
VTLVQEKTRRFAVCAAVFVAAMTLPGAAFASTGGEISSATATPDWTYGSFSGSVTYDLCASRVECKWSALLTVQPTFYQCDGNDPLPSGDRNVSLAWGTGPSAVDGTVPFDRQNWPIIRGVYGQRLCLYIWEQGKIEEPNPLCDILPPPCNPTRIRELYFFSTVASRIFTVQPPAPPPPVPPSPVSPTGSSQPASQLGSGLSKSRALSVARKALTRRYRRAYRRGKRKRLRCHRSGEKYRCSYSFRYHKKVRRGTVIVRSTADGLKASVRPKH